MTADRTWFDRRAAPRFDVIGDLWGTVEWTGSWTVRSISRGGALLEGTMPLAIDSEHPVLFSDGTFVAGGVVRVRRVEPGIVANYDIAIEFLELDDRLAVRIDEIVAEGSEQVS